MDRFKAVRIAIGSSVVVLARYGAGEDGVPRLSPSLASDADVDHWESQVIEDIRKAAIEAKEVIRKQRKLSPFGTKR